MKQNHTPEQVQIEVDELIDALKKVEPVADDLLKQIPKTPDLDQPQKKP